jgi:hypothetical protein
MNTTALRGSFSATMPWMQRAFSPTAWNRSTAISSRSAQATRAVATGVEAIELERFAESLTAGH